MRPYIVAMGGLLAISTTVTAGDEPIREFGPRDYAKGTIVALDEKTNSFDLRTPAGLIRGRNPESILIMDRYGAPLPEMTLSKLMERHYYLTVRTGGTEPSGNFKYSIIIEALP